ncbi:MAG: hypothetical protein IPK82_20210 [Polyangiaceae bacterium]|nr:hypothetical protein [Polyangiaceae bacterium]
MAIRCTDGTIDDNTLARWGARPPDTAVQLSVSDVRSCFEGFALDRAIAVTRLSAVQRVRLFADRPHVARWLTRIGRAITGPNARAQLRRAPTRALLFAAGAKSESSQIRRAIARWILGSRAPKSL